MNYMGNYLGVSWGNQTDPLNLVQVIAFSKNLQYFLSNQHLQIFSPVQINTCAIFVSLRSLCFGVYQNYNTEIQYQNRGFSKFQGTSQSFFLVCVLQTVEIKKISAPYTVYRVPHSGIRPGFLTFSTSH